MVSPFLPLRVLLCQLFWNLHFLQNLLVDVVHVLRDLLQRPLLHDLQ